MLEVGTQWLRVLRAVQETGSFTAAAETLGYTQSAVSKKVHALETATGRTLFRRGPRGVEPTEAGTLLAARAATILDQLEAAERELAEPGPAGRVALGAFPTAAMALVPRTLARARAAHPDVEIDFRESSTPVQLRRLRSGRLDLAVIAVGPDLPDYDLTGLRTEPLPAGPLLVAVPARHRFAGGPPVPVAELADEDWIAGRGLRDEPQFGAWPTLRAPRVVAEAADWTTRLGFVAAGLGLTTLPGLAAAAVPAGVVTVRVDDGARQGRELRLAWVGDLSPAAGTVRAVLRAEAARLAGRWSGPVIRAPLAPVGP